MTTDLEADYLVIGAGATAMAFVDELVHCADSVRILVVERRGGPGGHWNDAYDFVTLHQPAAFYGVNSRPLGKGGRDLASKDEILDYYRRVQSDLEATGRVQFFFGCESDGDTAFHDLLNRTSYRVRVSRKIVDSRYMNVTVPSTRPPAFHVDLTVKCVPINDLVNSAVEEERFLVIGSGKTGIDAVLYLLRRGVDPDSISWVVPNDAWLLDRSHFFDEGLAHSLEQELRILKKCKVWHEVFTAYEDSGLFLRLDPDIEPTRYRCATVTPDELHALRRIRDVIRLGRILRIDETGVHFEKGRRAFDAATVYVDCTADGLQRRTPQPIFQPGRIILQPVLLCQPTFSGALVGMIEAREESLDELNRLCRPVQYPHRPVDYFESTLRSLENIDVWRVTFGFRLFRMRLFLASHIRFRRMPKHILLATLYTRGAVKNLRRFADAVSDESARS